MTIRATPLWRLRAWRNAPRYLLYATCAAGLAAAARSAVDPPRSAPPPARTAAPSVDLGAQAFAALFARRYLSWNAESPQVSEQRLAPMVGAGLEANDGLRLPASGEQRVEWVEAVQQRELGPGEHVYTIAAQTDADGLVYLTVDVTRRADGRLALNGYPAFVGAPWTASGESQAHVRDVTDPSLSAIVERALRNYLAGSTGELAADLTSDARISVPATAMTLQAMRRLAWSGHGPSVLAVVQAQDGRGAEYTLGYELDVMRVGGRWEVSAVQMDPGT